MLSPPDTKHDWKFDSTRNAWFYMVNGNQRVYYSSTPRNLPPPVAGPAGRQFQPDNVALNYKHDASSGIGTLPIPIRFGPTAQSGRGPIVSPNFAGSPQPMSATGFSPNFQSPGAGIFQRQNSLGAPSAGGASLPANFPPNIAGGGGGFSPPSTTLRKVFEQGGGYVPSQPNPPPAGGGRGGRRPGQGGGNQPPPNQFPMGGGRGGGGSGRGGGGAGRGGKEPARGFQPTTNHAPNLSQVTTEVQQKILDKEFQVRKRPRQFFRLGKVFLMVHTENFGSRPEAKKAQATVNTSNPDAFVVAFGELVISKVRRFIVVSEQKKSCSALAITTHRGTGAAKNNASEHGIVYTGYEPKPLKNEGIMLTTAIRVDPFFRFDRLDVASRVDYAKTYNIEHNVKVKPYGMVNQQHMHHLVRQWTQVIMGRFNPAQNAFITPSVPALRALGFTQGMIQAVLNIMNRTRRPSADVKTSIKSVARSSAQFELQIEAEEDASEEQKLALKSEAEKLANHVVEFIMAGMTYHQAVDRVRQLSENGNGQGTENAAVGDIDDEDDDEEEEEADDD